MFGRNKGPGPMSSGMGGMLGGGNPMGPRTLNLVPAQGLSGNGMATIGVDNTFSVIAHLPAPQSISPYSPGVYAAYLVDHQGKNGFFAGTLRPAGNGMYQANFRSHVPLVHYDKVVLSLESPQRIGQAPQGPIVMQVKGGGIMDSLAPVRKAGSDIWGKVRGFVGARFGGKGEAVEAGPPEDGPVATSYQNSSGYPGASGYLNQGQQPSAAVPPQAPPVPGYHQTTRAFPSVGSYQPGQFGRNVFQPGQRRPGGQGSQHGFQGTYPGGFLNNRATAVPVYPAPPTPATPSTHPVNQTVPANPPEQLSPVNPVNPVNPVYTELHESVSSASPITAVSPEPAVEASIQEQGIE